MMAAIIVKNNILHTSVTADNSNYSTRYIDITITAETGWKIVPNSVTANYKYNAGAGSRDTTAACQYVSDTQIRVTGANWDQYSNLTVNGTSEQVSTGTVTVTVTNNIPNTTVSYEQSGNNYIFTIVADADYKFSGVPQFQFDNLSGDYVTVNGVLSANDTVTTATLNDVDVSSTITITGETVSSAVPEIALINNIPNTTAEVGYDGVTATFTVTGTYPQNIFINPIVNYTNKTGEQVNLPMTINEQTCIATVTDIDDTKTATLTGLYEQVCLITNNLTLCQPIEPLPSYIRSGETLTVTIQANAGTEFNAADNVPSVEYNAAENGDFVKLPFTISEDKNTATITVLADSVSFSGGLTLTGGAVPKQVIGSNYGAINVYKVTLEELDQFAKVRFFKEAGSDGTTFENIDLGKWVNRIKRIYTDVPVSSTDVIKCGNYDTGVECHAPAVETVTLNFGSVVVPAPNGNITDYDSEIRVFLPFSGFVSIPADYAGLSITLTYIINTITGDGIAKLSHNDIVFQTAEVKACSDVIYKLAETVVGGEMWDGIGLDGYEPYVYVKTFVSLNNTGRNNDSIRGKLGDFRGFNVFDDVSVITTNKMLTVEQETIYRALRSGVYID